jgi:hypothetical protein
MADPISATLGKEAIDQASGLVERWVVSIKDRDDQIAARILYEATLALARMRTYCNQVRVVHLPLRRFSLDWPPDRRAELRDAWAPWASIFDILPALETVTDTLYLREVRLPTRWWRDKEDQRAVAALETELAGTVAMFINDVAYAIKHAKIYIDPVDFDTDDQSIKDFAQLAMKVVEDPGDALIARARTAVVRMRQIVLRQRSGLPEHVWQQLDALAFGG